MDFTISASAQQYLADLNQTQAQINQAQSQVSSGLKVQQASDDPSAITEILQLQTTLAQNQQIQTNLGSVSDELNAADSSLQSALQVVQNAISIAAQGSSSSVSADDRTNFAQAVAGLQQTLVDITQTRFDGRYIFSGDDATQPPYALDPTQPEGVQQLVTAGSTRTIQSVNGTSIAVAKTAAEIFDPQSNGAPTAQNTFAAINSLLTSLQNNDTAGVNAAAASLQTASTYLNDQLAFYGEAENQISTATTLAQQFQLQEKSNLSQDQDADIPTAALELTQAQTQQQAELSVAAKIQQAPNLFSMLA
jgi:flagellar hook-associated protein 3 FlgL